MSLTGEAEIYKPHIDKAFMGTHNCQCVSHEQFKQTANATYYDY